MTDASLDAWWKPAAYEPALSALVEPLVQALPAQPPAQPHELVSALATALRLQACWHCTHLPPPVTRIPGAVLRDVRPGGGAFTVLRTLLAFAAKQLAPPSDVEVVTHMHAALRTAGLMPHLRVALAPDVTSDAAARLEGIVRLFGGSVLSSHGSSPETVSHVLSLGALGVPPPLADTVHARVVDVRGDKALLHVRGTPTSADQWVTRAPPPTGDPPLQPFHIGAGGANASKPPLVSAMWLASSIMARELLPWEDFEVGTSAASCQWLTLPATSVRPYELPHKKARLGDSVPVAPASAFHAQAPPLPPGVIQRPSVGPLPETTARRTENISQGLIAPGAMPGVLPVPAKSNPSLGGTAGNGGTGATSSHLPSSSFHVPAHASWFSFDAVHDIERKALPEFFTSSTPGSLRTSDTYAAMRNAIVRRWRENPSARLTFTAVRSSLVGEVNSMHRVFHQLQHWGLINNHVSASGQPSTSAVPVPVPAVPVPTAVEAVEATPVDVQPQARLNPVPLPAPRHALYDFTAHGVVYGTNSGLSGALDAVAAVNPASAAANTRLAAGCAFCCVCGKQLVSPLEPSDMWYHCTRVPDFYLCAQHFAEGRFPGDTAAGDFVKHDGSALALALSASAPNSCAGRWTDSETLLLLEALTTSSGNSDDWGRIASHVGTKSKAQCLAHFLALPIQERFLDDMEGRPSAPAAVATALAAGAVGGEDVGAAPEEVRDAFAGPHLIPFQDAGNPIMAQCAFMAAVVGPRVAAAAAAAALAALEHEESAAAAGAVPMDTDGGPHFSAAAIRRSLAVCLAGGAVKAKMMADQEERDIHRTVVGVIDSQAKKVDAKMKLVLQLDNLLREETAAVVAAQAAALQGP